VPTEHCSVTTVQAGTSAPKTFQNAGNIPSLVDRVYRSTTFVCLRV
jgi:hypothetical protein